MLSYLNVLIFLAVLEHTCAEICPGKNFPKSWIEPFTAQLETHRIDFLRERQRLKYLCGLADEVQEFLDHSKRVKGWILARLYKSDVNDKSFHKLADKTISYWKRTMRSEFTKAMKVASEFACAVRSINTDINLLACVFR